MPRYRLNALGDQEFESLAQALLKKVIGAGTITFGPGRDGGREATFEGTAPYPSESETWSGSWIFQVKFHDTELIGTQRARANVIADLATELDKITKKYKRKCDNYILITNVPLSAVNKAGTLDRAQEVFELYRKKIPHLALWGGDDIHRFLDIYSEVRTSYLPLLISGDIIAQLLALADVPKSERATTVDLYLRSAIAREEYAQLDQAGDVSEDPIPLQRVFFDLDAYVPAIVKDAVDRLRRRVPAVQIPYGEDYRTEIARLLANTSIDRAVLVGGPGEGKSTIGQYLAQLHRSTLLGKSEDIALSQEYVPEIPRLPFRIVLKDFAQWLAHRSLEPSDKSDSLDSYISGQVARLSSRPFTDKDLHEVLKSNPILLVLDGLDEVTDPAVRKRLISRLIEFINRSETGLRCDLQVIATTRPTGYSDQFDPKSFIHFRLNKLRSEQVKAYVQKWAAERLVDEGKAERLRLTIDECLADPQIRLLMTTPLQVTILILIINSGGTPPRQREALFDEYLEVIYKREKAKGLGIIKSEKELLIGLHKYVGFLLQEEATRARTSGALLPRSEYDQVVMKYLRKHDPYSPNSEIETEWRAITIDAGERLVLIIESPADVFGFELRSIQEFFAACYLSDTASNTAERYDRLTIIARLTHWRNVTLFFAGRVGRNTPGEAANVVEVCRDIDRSGPDLFARRGAEVALELAADRALEPNRVLQRSLLEHGLDFFSSPLSAAARSSAIELLRRLPQEDIRDHVLPILEERLRIANLVISSNMFHILSEIAPECDLFRTCALDLALQVNISDEQLIADIVSAIADIEVPNYLRLAMIKRLLSRGVEADLIASNLSAVPWETLYVIAEDIDRSDIGSEFIARFAHAIARSVTFLGRLSAQDIPVRHGKSPLIRLLHVTRIVGMLIATSEQMALGHADRLISLRDQVATELTDDIKYGDFNIDSTVESATWILWLAHLSLGVVTEESWSRFLDWRAAHEMDDELRELWLYCARTTSPIVNLGAEGPARHDARHLREIAISFGGSSGFTEWMRRLQVLESRLRVISPSARAKLSWYGLSVLPTNRRQVITDSLNELFPEEVRLMALHSLRGVNEDDSLDRDEASRVIHEFALRNHSDWNSDFVAYRILSESISFGLLTSPDARIIWNRTPFYLLASIALRIVVSDKVERDVTTTFFRESALSTHVDELQRNYIISHLSELRSMLIGLVDLVFDNDCRVREVARALIISACRESSTREGKRRSIRSRELDMAQGRLLATEDSLGRAAGIALYSVRPPRSQADWRLLRKLLKDGTIEDTRRYWSWVMPVAAKLTNQPEVWIPEITSILHAGVCEPMLVVLSDVLRNLLPRESQSLAPLFRQVGLHSHDGVAR